MLLLALAMPNVMCYPTGAPDPDHIPMVQSGKLFRYYLFIVPLIVDSATDESDEVSMDAMLQMIQQAGDDDEKKDGGLIMQQQEEEYGTEQPDIQGFRLPQRCYTDLYVMAFTSGSRNAGSDDLPYLLVDLFNHEEGAAPFPNRPGNDMLENKGDFWRFNLRRDLKLRKSCIRKADFNTIVIQNGGNDGWKIESIVTILRTGSYYTVLTANIDFHTFVDGNPSGSRSFHQITLAKTSNA